MKKYDRSKSGFSGKRHNNYSRSQIGEGNRRAWSKRPRFNQYQLKEIVELIRRGRAVDYVASYFGATPRTISLAYWRETGQTVREYRNATLGR